MHENGRLSERDKPKASSCELDVVFGIPNSREKGFFPPADAELAPSKHLAPSASAPALPAPIIFWVQRLRKYCCNPVWLRRKQHSPSAINLSLVSRRTAQKWRCAFIQGGGGGGGGAFSRKQTENEVYARLAAQTGSRTNMEAANKF